jgi:UDP-2,3-diacylglucosamine pyrophosphatase LpxH
MNKDTVRYLAISDIHLGHPRNTTEEIIKALDTFFENYSTDPQLDIIFIVGDLFDRLLDFSSEESRISTLWAARLIRYCGEYNIKLRVLEGTPSHDWGQSEIFNTIHHVSNLPVDMKYMNSLCIEHIEDLGITVLYIPDEWTSSTEKTFEEVKEQLAIHSLKQVDIAMMHGNFNYQLPMQAIKAPRHNEENYLSIVKYFISIGHIHTSSVNSRILAQGSFDRLSHGEEEAKGGIRCEINKDGTCEYFFIENKAAKIFKTIKIRSLDLDQCVQQIERQTAKLPTDSYIRIKAKKDHPIIIGFDEIKKRFPHFVMSKITIEEEDQNKFNLIEDVQDQSVYIPITITRDNIQALLFDEIRQRYDFSPQQYLIAERDLQEAI